jgi:DNA helicase-2/ATP-dependent DNA helicase PcrA
MFDAINDSKGNAFKDIILKLQKDREILSLTELIDKVLDETKIKEELESDESLENELRLDNLNEFKSITEAFINRTGSNDISDFLEEISLVSDIEEHRKNDNAVTLMTLHSAKGLEYKVVFIVGMEDGIFPHQNSFCEAGGLEEERRLCYVGITRAKEKLYLSNAKKRMLYGKENLTVPSRFLKEIPDEYIEVTSSSVKEAKKLDKTTMFYDEEQEYNVGQVVMHDIYGKGVVVGVDDKFLTIAFNKKFGIKKLMKNHSSIKKV